MQKVWHSVNSQGTIWINDRGSLFFSGVNNYGENLSRCCSTQFVPTECELDILET